MQTFDLLVIGGGINGAAIARAATGRGLKVLLVEKDDLASHTSSASSKLIHGGLRYLEYYEFRLVREALKEREVLLRTAPHIIRPLSFVLPHGQGMRPWWMIRSGLKLYDLLAGRGTLPHARQVKDARFAAPLKVSARGRLALYWDAWVDDARLVALNALAAHEGGAEITTRTALLSARREGEAWIASLSDGRELRAGMIANAAGPWVAEVLNGALAERSESRVRLVKGSHIVVPALYDGDHAYILQQPDGRVVFAIPYEGKFTLVGTTDVPVERPEDAAISADEVEYLCAAANLYFERQIGAGDVRWSFSGVRSLYDDGAASAQAVTRDYHLELSADGTLLSIFGGKITTARALAEEALDKLAVPGRKTTLWSSLPGGDVGVGFNLWLESLSRWVEPGLLARLSRAYGTRLQILLGDAEGEGGLGRYFGAGLYEAEVRFLMTHEFARTADDILWRRTKIGLHMSNTERRSLERWIAEQSDLTPR